MKIDFSKGTVTLVVTPCDMRGGYRSLSAIAHACLDIDVDRGEDFVVFTSKDRKTCKVIWSDAKGTVCATRKLHAGTFKRLLVRAEESAGLAITPSELAAFLNGGALQVERTGFFGPAF